jgi:hypothetical protein
MTPVIGCHAGAGHGEPTDRGPWGWLCAPCWAWVERLRARLRGRPDFPDAVCGGASGNSNRAQSLDNIGATSRREN